VGQNFWNPQYTEWKLIAQREQSSRVHCATRDRMLDMLKRHEIQVLCKAGHNATEVAAPAGVSRRSVRRVEAEAVVTHVDTAAEIERRGVGRPSTAKSLRGFVLELLAAEPTLLSLQLLRRAKLKGYAGSKSAFYALVASLRPTPSRPVIRFEGLPGEFSQHVFY
jgi:hypothetical protein